MTPVDHNNLYPMIEKVLRSANKPLNCHEIFDLKEVRKIAPSANRVSDYLGVMYRKGVVSRVPAEPGSNSKARWSYVWREKVTPEWKKQVGLKVEPAEFRPKLVLDRPNLHITEEGNHLLIDMAGLQITIKIKDDKQR